LFFPSGGQKNFSGGTGWPMPSEFDVFGPLSIVGHRKASGPHLWQMPRDASRPFSAGKSASLDPARGVRFFFCISRTGRVRAGGRGKSDGPGSAGRLVNRGFAKFFQGWFFQLWEFDRNDFAGLRGTRRHGFCWRRLAVWLVGLRGAFFCFGTFGMLKGWCLAAFYSRNKDTRAIPSSSHGAGSKMAPALEPQDENNCRADQ